jgi:hypothetical protein
MLGAAEILLATWPDDQAVRCRCSPRMHGRTRMATDQLTVGYRCTSSSRGRPDGVMTG